MKNVALPSGQTVLNLSKAPAAPANTTEASSKMMKSESGAMIIDRDGKCPKCHKQMGFASVAGEQVYYCATDRVSLPLPIVE